MDYTSRKMDRLGLAECGWNQPSLPRENGRGVCNGNGHVDHEAADDVGIDRAFCFLSAGHASPHQAPAASPVAIRLMQLIIWAAPRDFRNGQRERAWDLRGTFNVRCRFTVSVWTHRDRRRVLFSGDEFARAYAYERRGGDFRHPTHWDIELVRPLAVTREHLTVERPDRTWRTLLPSECHMEMSVEGLGGGEKPGLPRWFSPGEDVVLRFDLGTEGEWLPKELEGYRRDFPLPPGHILVALPDWDVDPELSAGCRLADGRQGAPADEMEMFPRRTNGLVNGDVFRAATNGNEHHPHYSQDDDDMMGDGETAADGHHTETNGNDAIGNGEAATSRSLRVRGREKVSYNLKALSDKAHGTERKKRKQPHQQPGRPPTKRVDGEGFLDADEWWDPARQRPLDGGEVPWARSNAEQPQASNNQPQPARPRAPPPPLESVPSLAPQPSTGPSSNNHGGNIAVATSSSTTNHPQAPIVLIPPMKTTVYHPLSKVELKPGQPVPGRAGGDEWLIQRHRDLLEDYQDIERSEKEYMMEWDGFLFREERLASEAYLERAVLNFATTRAAWIAAKEERRLEFGKHLAVLKARGVISDETLAAAVATLGKEMATRKIEGSPAAAQLREEEERAQEKTGRGGKAGCAVCRKPVLGPSLLVCANRACTRRLYHDHCARPNAVVPVERGRRWRCNECAGT